MKRNVILLVFISVIFFFITTSHKLKAEETIIYEVPLAKDIIYGDHLYKAELLGGSANTSGVFLWKNELEVLDVGTYERTAVFTPYDTNFDKKEITVSFNVLQKKISLSFEREIKKQYDETTLFKLPNYTITGIIDKETYISGIPTATSESILVGENIPIKIDGLSIEGNKKNNYYLDLANITGTIYPKYIEKAGKYNSKITFVDDIYIPSNSTLVINSVSTDITKEGYVIKDYYDIYLKSNTTRLSDINGKINLKFKLDKTINSKKIIAFNYHDGEYEKISYDISEDGYITYTVTALGALVLTEKKPNFTWLYVVLSCILIIALIFFLINTYANKPKKAKIIKYKSLKRSKKNGYNM